MDLKKFIKNGNCQPSGGRPPKAIGGGYGGGLVNDCGLSWAVLVAILA